MTPLDGAMLVVAFCVAVVLVSAIVLVLWWIDRYDREPLVMVAAALIWGAVCAPAMLIGVSALLAPMPMLEGLSSERGWVVFLLAPAATEIAKGIGLLLVLSKTRTFDSPTDGFVHGAAVGAGFAVSGGFVTGIWAEAGSAGAWFDAGVLPSVLWFTGVHLLASSLMGACVGAGRLTSSWIRRSAWIVLALVGAVGLDALATWLVVRSEVGSLAGGPWMLIGPVYVLFVGLACLVLFAEGRVLRRQLADEVRLGVLPDWTVQVIPSYWRRVRSDWWPLRRERTVISRLLTKLAFRKQALGVAHPGESNLEGLEIVWLRERIQKIVCPPKSPISPLTEEMW